jgi:putative dimethyl sulfoxide reductase chaperone
MAEELTAELREAIAEDLDTLVLLQDRELDAAMLEALGELGFPDNLALLPGDARGRQAFDLMREAVHALPQRPDQAFLDHLAADYAAIYLNGSLGASPMESVWLSDDRTACHEPMFELRAVYAERGLGAADWRCRPDDHLLLQFQFIAHWLREPQPDLAGLADFLDRHLLRWVGDFAGRVAARCESGLYAGLALLTFAVVERLRDVLALSLAVPRPSREAVEAACRSRIGAAAVSVGFVPGAGPGW